MTTATQKGLNRYAVTTSAGTTYTVVAATAWGAGLAVEAELDRRGEDTVTVETVERTTTTSRETHDGHV